MFVVLPLTQFLRGPHCEVYHAARCTTLWGVPPSEVYHPARCTTLRGVQVLLLLLGAFSEWLSEHPDVIGRVLPLLLQGLRDPLLAQSASMSLKDLVRECQLHLQPYASSILVAAKVSMLS